MMELRMQISFFLFQWLWLIQIVGVVWVVALSIRVWIYMGQQQKTLKQIHALLYKHIIAKP